MKLKKTKILALCQMLIWVTVVFSLISFVQCQDVNDYNEFNNPAVLPLITQVVYRRLENLTSIISKDISRQSSFCIKDSENDWNQAFNFSSNLDFLTSCIQKTRGDITRRICTAAEMKFYFNSFFDPSAAASHLRPNRNCNLTSWVPGCEPGWACSVGVDQPVEFDNSRVIPSRTQSCQTCCEGFFCPQGLTCMIPCPLGSYCPLATLNKTTGLCEPYNYQLPPGQRNHTCGGANIWADVGRSSEIFCSGGSYCPTTVQRINCSSGHYCRMGSVSETNCFKLTSCKANSSSQNIHAYGVLLIVAMAMVLILIYNCSDQVLTTRERRLAKSREAAARNARETAKARQRWKNAKDSAKKHASGLQAHLSRTFSRKRFDKNPEKFRILDQDKTGTQEDLYPPTQSSSLSASLPPPAPSNGKIKEPSDLMQIMHEIEKDPDNYVGIEMSDSNITGQKPSNAAKHTPIRKEISTHSQIFKYAYAQLEKEKAMEELQKNLTFSGVVNMAANTNTEIKKRPPIEISFKDLTLTLKTQHTHLLRCVTGKIKPGRITAVMGPSGAGKTTLLSAIAGKTIGCRVGGSVLINGRHELIQSYKKIIGFVPQDDIVHGNLTVEENLWFSAHCRLSADLPKADKFLVVERVIESLGLQAVRDSLVGTVEKRGISGGQRKRVNVGLEMVMEPSLLILDEPTSGLDSASSQLLLRALRRESLEGVNVCMVVHQPSYALFKMFDDLILLAKGGLTVYHGSVKKVEEYFNGLGINVPERVNPPDHYIDILEGIVMPSASSGVNFKDLPVRWMLYNGYPVPLDMQHYVSRIEGSVNRSPEHAGGVGKEDHSFVGDLWHDLKGHVELQRDHLHHNFLKSRDMSNRRTPGVYQQYRYYLGRVGKQRLREAKMQAIDYLILLFAGACLGSVTKFNDTNFGAAGYTYTIIAVSLLCKVAALRSFTLDKLQYLRESSSGMSTLAYFLAKDTIDHFNTVVKPVVYLSMFYAFTNPRSSFADNYSVLLCLVYCVTGIGYALAIFFQPGAAQLWSVLLPVVLTLIATQPKDNSALEIISKLCYPQWALEAFVIANSERYYGVWLITRCGSLLRSGYNLHNWYVCISILLGIGVATRFVAFFGLVTLKKK